MSVELNHTIVWARDDEASAAFLAGILGLPAEPRFGNFVPLRLSNGVTLDYASADHVAPQHYAFALSEAVFERAFDRVRDAGIEYYADPAHHQPGVLNHRFGGRGFYFADPDGHNMELFTQPAGRE